MQEGQYKIYKNIKNASNQDLHDIKTRTLITLAYVILSGYNYPLDLYVKKAIEYGATKRDFLNVITCIFGDMRPLNSILELFRILDDNFQEGGDKK